MRNGPFFIEILRGADDEDDDDNEWFVSMLIPLLSLKLKSGTESHNWKLYGLLRLEWVVWNVEWHGNAAKDARERGNPCVMRSAWRRSLLINVHSWYQIKRKIKENHVKYLTGTTLNRRANILPPVIRTNLLVQFRFAIKLCLLCPERDLLHYMNGDSATRLFPHPPILSKFRIHWMKIQAVTYSQNLDLFPNAAQMSVFEFTLNMNWPMSEIPFPERLKQCK